MGYRTVRAGAAAALICALAPLGCTFERKGITAAFIKPELTDFTITPNPASANAVVDIRFTANEELAEPPEVVVGDRLAVQQARVEIPEGIRWGFVYQTTGTEPEGPNEVRVSARDVDGNLAEVLGTLELDFTSPQLTDFSPMPPLVGLGVTTELFFTADEPLADVMAQVEGNPTVYVAQNADATLWHLAYTPGGFETEGDVPVVVRLEDLAGNAGVYNRQISLDFTPPVVSGVVVSHSVAIISDTVTITFTVSGDLSGSPVVTVDGNNAIQTSTMAGGGFVFEYTVTGSETEGQVWINIDAFDAAGNVGSNGELIVLDFGPPVVNVVQVKPNPARAGVPVTIDFTVSEDLPNPPTVAVDSNAADPSWMAPGFWRYLYFPDGSELEGNVLVDITATDFAGSTGVDSTMLTLDFSPPSLNLALSSSTATSGDTLTITVDSSELLPVAPAVSVDGIAVSFQSLNGMQYGYDHTVSDIEADGSIEVKAVGYDLAGNLAEDEVALTLDARPRVVATYPLDGALGVPPNDAIVVQFSEPMMSASVSSAITVSGAATTVMYDGVTSSARVTAGGPLTDGTSYTVNVSTAASDLGGLAMGSGFSFTFTTGSAATAVISGWVQYPPDWTRPRVMETLSGEVADVAADDTYAIVVDRVPNNDLFLWNDADGDGDWDAGEPRMIHWDCGTRPPPLSTVTGNLSGVNFYWTRISGVLNAPGSWTNPSVLERNSQSSTPVDGSNYYELDLTTGRYDGSLFAFDDLDSDGAIGPSEPHLPLRDQVDLCFMIPPLPYDLVLRDIQGRFTQPTDATWNAKIMVSQAPGHPGQQVQVLTPNGNGDYIATVSSASFAIFAFDDADSNNRWDPITEERVRASIREVRASVYDVSGINIVTRTYASPGSPPFDSWRTAVMGAPQSFEFIFHGSTANSPSIHVHAGAADDLFIYTFDDLNNDGVLQIDVEPAVRFDGNPVDTRDGDPTGPLVRQILAGAFSALPGWSKPELVALQGQARTYGSLNMGTYWVDVGAHPETKLFIYDDQNANALWDPAESHLRVAGPIDTSMVGGNPTLTMCEISGTFTPPWPQTELMVVGPDSRGAASVVGMTYTAWLEPAVAGNRLVLYYDRNGDGSMQPSEPQADVGNVNSTVCTGMGPALGTHTVSGSADAPPIWAAPTVMHQAFESNTQRVTGSSYTLMTGVGNASMVLFDDLNRDGLRDAGEPFYLRPGNVDSSGNPSGIDLEYVDIRGRLVPPPSWVRPHADSNAGAAVAARPDRSFTAYSGRTSNGVLHMFEDSNRDGSVEILSPGEHRIAHRFNPVDLDSNSVAGVIIDYSRISGFADFPPGWTNPMVGTLAEDATGVPVGGNYDLFVSWDSYTVIMFDDLNLNGRRDLGDPVIAHPFTINAANGPVTDVDIYFRIIGGQAYPPPTWSNARVRVEGSSTRVGLIGASDDFTEYVQPGSTYFLYMFDDRNRDDFRDASEPRIARGGSVDLTLTDVTNLIIDHTTITGTAAHPMNWVRPRVVARFTSLDEPITGGVFTLFVGFAPYNVVMYDDFNGNRRHDQGEEAYILCSGSPIEVDTTAGAAGGYTIDTACPYSP